MWSIGIKSGIITLLLFIAYELAIQTWGLQSTIWGHLEQLVFMVGIYSAQYYYKYANNGLMTYKQGLQVAMITVLFTSLVAGLAFYALALTYGNHFIQPFVAALQDTFQQIDANPTFLQRILAYAISLPAPIILACFVFLSILCTGFVFALFITLFSRTGNY